MRVLTVKQPWAWAIIHGGKDVENRVRSLGPYRGPVAIHAGLSVAYDVIGDPPTVLSRAVGQWRHEEFLARVHAYPWSNDLGHIIGVVDLTDVHPDCTEPVEGYGHTPTCSRWAMSGHHHLVLANLRPLPRPIPARGMLGLWRPDADLLGAITVQIAERADGSTQLNTAARERIA